MRFNWLQRAFSTIHHLSRGKNSTKIGHILTLAVFALSCPLKKPSSWTISVSMKVLNCRLLSLMVATSAAKICMQIFACRGPAQLARFPWTSNCNQTCAATSQGNFYEYQVSSLFLLIGCAGHMGIVCWILWLLWTLAMPRIYCSFLRCATKIQTVAWAQKISTHAKCFLRKEMQDDASIWQLEHIEMLDTLEVEAAPGLSHVLRHEALQQGPGDVGHWWGVSLRDTAEVEVFDPIARKIKLQMPFSTWVASCSNGTGLTFFSLQEVTAKKEITTMGPYELRGSVHKRPAAVAQSSREAPRLREVSCPLTHCCICRGPLHNKASCEAQVYTMLGVESVQHMRKRCAQKTRRAHYGYNYVSTGGRKMNVLEPEQMEYIFVSATAGFTKGFIEYHDTLRFRGFLTKKAIQLAQKQHMQPELMSKWEQYYSRASIILNVVNEYAQWASSQSCDERLKLLRSIDLDGPLKEKQLAMYCTWWTESVMSLPERTRESCNQMPGWSSVQRWPPTSIRWGSSIQQWMVHGLQSWQRLDLACSWIEGAWEQPGCSESCLWDPSSVSQVKLRYLWSRLLDHSRCYKKEVSEPDQVLARWQISRQRSRTWMPLSPWEHSSLETSTERCQH